MDSQKIKAVLIVFIAAIAALYLGVAAATEQVAAIAWIVGGLSLVFILALGKNVWLLIAGSVVLNGALSFVPGAPPPWWLAMAATACIFALRFLLSRGKEFTWHWSFLDVVILLHIIMLAQAYYRNPAGLSFFGGSGEGVVGGKPYLAHSFAIACYVLLSMIRANMRIFKIASILMIMCSFVDGFVILVGTFIPAFAAVGLQFYTGFSFAAATKGLGANIMEGRTIEGKGIGEDLGKTAFTLYRPMSTLNPLRVIPFSMMIFAVGLVMISGFRSSMGLLGIYFIVCSLIRRQVGDVLASLALALVFLSVVTFIGTDGLPRAGQRILSVLPIPGLVDEGVAANAEKSTEWRVEMWKLALTSDRYIFNKWLGDGFGIRKDEMDAQIEAAFGDRRRMVGMDQQAEMMSRGSYHGFHVQTIRMTGYIGLLAVLVMLGVFFRHAWNHIEHFRGRPEWGYVLFVCVPFLVFPFYAMLVFGDYRIGIPRVIIMAGFLKMLWNIRFAETKELSQKESEGAQSIKAGHFTSKHLPRSFPAKA